MKTFLLTFTVIGIFFLSSCETKKKTETTEIPEAATTPTLASNGKAPDGLSLMKTLCYSCHDAQAGGNGRLAPPMFAVRMHYLRDHPEEADFVNNIVSFLGNPSKEKAKLIPAIERFGLMPNMGYPEGQIREIATYLYHNEQEHGGHGGGKGQGKGKGMGMGKGQEGAQADPAEMSVQEAGMHYALTTKAQLGKNLMAAIQQKGTAGAVDFCNIRALPLTDSMAQVHGVQIKRVSDKPRNSGNKASMAELKHIANFKLALERGEKPTPIVEETENQVRFYSPILTNQMCLQCHGTPDKELSLDVLQVIRSKYPDDKAIGYGENQVRGIWSIEWKKM